MTGGLPEGLVTNTEEITGDIESVDHVTVEDISQLWKVYGINKNLLANDVGKRLENFFWRIWGNKSIRENISGSHVAVLFNRISQGEVIRTTPTPSPRSNSFLPEQRQGSSQGKQALLQDSSSEAIRLDQSQHSEPSEDQIDPPSDQRLTNPSETSTTVIEKGKRRDFVRPPPILKKSRTSSSTQQTKTARILTPTWKTQHDDEDDDEKSPATSASNESEEDSAEGLKLRTADLTRSEEEFNYREEMLPGAHSSKASSRAPVTENVTSSTKAGKKKSSFVASTTSTKRRPAIIHRKSSQSSSGNSKAPSPRLASQTKPSTASILPLPQNSSSSWQNSIAFELPSDEGSDESSDSFPKKHNSSLSQSIKPSAPRSSRISQSARTSRSASPASYRPFQQPSLGNLALGGNPERVDSPLQDWVVDRDFRSKFVSRVQPPSLIAPQDPSFSTTPLPGRSKSNTTYDDTGVDNGNGNMSIDERYISKKGMLKVPGAESSAIEDEDEEEEEEDLPTVVTLPRTKSQISLMVEDERRRKSGKATTTTSGKGKGKKRY